MENIKLSDIVRITGGICQSTEDFPVSGMETDSRRIKKGDVYIAIIGERVDGHTFISGAAENGAVCAIVSNDINNSPIPTVKVESSEKALQAIAKHYFDMISPLAVAVTGSCGKTTTKEMLALVFASKYNILKTEGNYNSVIGLPLTVARLTGQNKAAILEMGTGDKGEIQTMCDIVKPDISVISNIGTSHIEFLGSREGIAKEKTDIFRNTKPDGTLIVNADDEMLNKVMQAESFMQKQITYGIDNPADVTASNIGSYMEDGSYITEFDVNYRGKAHRAQIRTLGTHNVYNAISALAAGIAGGIPLDISIPALKEFIPDDMRMKIFKCIDGVTVISDVYNANPQAVKASLDVLAGFPSGRRIAVLGDMLEQGDIAEEVHTDVGRYAAKCASLLITRGDMSVHTAGGAAEEMPYKSIHTVHTNEEVIEYLSTFDFCKDDTFLIKGSRGMKMEEISDYIIKGRFTY